MEILFCKICNKESNDSELCSLCKKLKPTIQFDLLNQRNSEQPSDLLLRKELYKTVIEFYNLYFKSKSVPKSREIVLEFLKIKNLIINHSEFKTILDKINSETNNKEGFCTHCNCFIGGKTKNALCESCYIMVDL